MLSYPEIFVGRTLQLHALSPLHVPALKKAGSSSKAAFSGSLSPQTFETLSTELRSYINIRLSDGMSVLYSSTGPSGGGGAAADLSGQRDDALLGNADGNDLPVSKRRRIGETVGSGQISNVRMSWLPELDLVDPLNSLSKTGKKSTSASQTDLDESSQAWAIEIELARPPEPFMRANAKRTSKAAFKREKALKVARLADMTHLVFLPSVTGAERASATSTALSYPVLVTKSSSSGPPDVNRAILSHALNWLQARFDCRIASAGAAASRRIHGFSGAGESGAHTGPELEKLAEKIIAQARFEKEEIDKLTFRGKASRRSLNNTDEGMGDSIYAAGPVEMAFSFPTEVLDDLKMDGSKIPGPAPELNTITLTVPWPVCVRLLDESADGTSISLTEALLSASILTPPLIPHRHAPAPGTTRIPYATRVAGPLTNYAIQNWRSGHQLRPLVNSLQAQVLRLGAQCGISNIAEHAAGACRTCAAPFAEHD